MDLPNKDKIQAALKMQVDSKKDLLNTGLPTQQNYLASIKTEDNQKIGKVDFEVPLSEIYTRMSDGSYQAKLDNYIGATGNENRLANEQGWGEQALYGLAKNFRKMGNYALDGTVGTVIGLVNGIQEGKTSAIWDNDFSNTMDDWNKSLDGKLPSYYSDEEKSAGFLSSVGTANFWFNDVANGLAFVGGAILPSIALGGVTGGATLGTGLGKLSLKAGLKGFGDDILKAGTKKLGKQALTEVEKQVLNGKGKDFLRAYNIANGFKKTGDAVSTATFLATSSSFEAGMEARQAFHGSIEKYFNEFETINGKPPTSEQSTAFIDKARSAANGVYATNLAILAVSNAAMFGKTLDLGIIPKALKYDLGNYVNKAVGLNVTQKVGEKAVLQTATKAQKILGRTTNVLKGTLMEGLYEEGLQGVTTKVMSNYLESTYDPSKRYAEDFAANLGEAFKEQYGTKEGWKEIGIGMLIGYMGGSLRGQAPAGFGKNTYKAKVAEKQAQVDSINTGIESLETDLQNNAGTGNKVRAMAKANSSRDSRNGVETGFTSLEAIRTNLDFIQSQEGVKPESAMLNDFNAIVDKMEVTNEDADKLTSTYDINDTDTTSAREQAVSRYKQDIREEFTNTLKNYKKARNGVDAIGLGRNVTKGDATNVRDAMIWNIMAGRDALDNANRVGSEIAKATGKGGAVEALAYYNGLNAQQRENVQETQRITQELKTVRERAIQTQNQLAQIQTQRKGNPNSPALESTFRSLSEQYAIANVRLQELEESKTTLLEGLQEAFDVNQSQIGNTDVTSMLFSAEGVVDELSKLDSYENSLRITGKTNEANALQQMRLEYQGFYDMHSEMMSAHQKMASTNFFSSKEGNTLLSGLIGPKYVMSDEMRKLIKDNEAIIDDSLSRVGINRTGTIEEYIQTKIAENPELSEREKYRLEAILRLQLNQTKFEEISSQIQKLSEEIEADKQSDKTRLDGDTITLKRKLNLKTEKLGSIELINQAIKEITEQIEFLKSKAVNKDKLDSLNLKLEELLAQKANQSIVAENPQVVITGIDNAIENGTGQTQISGVENGSIDITIDKTTNTAEISNSQATNFESYKELGQRLIQKGITLISPNTSNRTPQETEAWERLVAEGLAFGTEADGYIYLGVPVEEVIGEQNIDLTYKMQELQDKLEEVQGDLASEKDLEDFLDGFISDLEQTVGNDIKDSQTEVNNVRALFASKSKARTQKGQQATNKVSEIETELRETLTSANQILERLRQTKERQEQLDKIQKDILNQINYYKQLASSGTVSVKEVQERIEKLQGKRKTVVTLLEKVQDKINGFKQLLSDLIDLIFVRQNSLEQFKAITGFNQRTLEEVRSDLKNGVLQEGYGALANDFAEIEQGLNTLLDNAETKEQEIEVSQELQNSFDNTLQNIDNSTRYLNELLELETFTATENQNPVAAQQQSTPGSESINITQVDNSSLDQQQSTTVSDPTNTTQVDNSSLDQEIAALKQAIDTESGNIRLVDSIEFKRYTELLKKQQTKGLTEVEQTEIEELSESIDRYMFAVGAVAQGIRLSDLIEQKSLLENLKITNQQNIELATVTDAVESNNVIGDKVNAINSDIGQSFDRTIASYKKGQNGVFVEITGIKAADAAQYFTYRDENGVLQPIEDITFLDNEYGNLVLTEEDVKKVNATVGRTISIPNVGNSIARNYYMVVGYNLNTKGEEVGSAIPSIKNEDYTERPEPQDIYDLQEDNEQTPGSTLELKIDTRDEYNKQLIADYKEAKENYDVADSKVQSNSTIELEETYKNNAELQELERDIEKLKKAKKDKKITKQGEEALTSLRKRRDSVKGSLKREVAANAKGNLSELKSEVERTKEILRKSIRITAFSQGKTILSLKGKVSETREVSRELDIQFQQFRDSIIDNDDFLEQIVNMPDMLATVTHGKITVKKVLIGMPNFIFEKTNEGQDAIVFKQIGVESTSKVEDIGYIEDGKTRTKSEVKGIDTTFLTSTIKKSPKSKVPFIVVKVGNKRVALPVKIMEEKQPDNTELQTVFNSSAPTIDKVKRINEILAQKGLDVKEAKNSFYVVGEVTNLTEENFNDVLSKLNNMEYFYSVEDWFNKQTTLEEILTQQVMVNVDLSSPLHSPKVIMNMEGALKNFVVEEKPKTEQEAQVEKKAKASATTTKQSDVAAKYSAAPTQRELDKEAKKNQEDNGNCV